MIRRRTYHNNVKTAQIVRMHACIDASIATLQPDNGEEICATCHGRIPEGQELLPDPSEHRTGRMVFCSEDCQAMQAHIRL
jgi:hypothetical protein